MLWAGILDCVKRERELSISIIALCNFDKGCDMPSYPEPVRQ